MIIQSYMRLGYPRPPIPFRALRRVVKNANTASEAESVLRGLCLCLCLCSLFAAIFLWSWWMVLYFGWPCQPTPLHASHNRIFAHKFVKLRFGLLLNLPLPFNVFPITRVRTQSNWSDYDTNTRSCRSTTYPWAE